VFSLYVDATAALTAILQAALKKLSTKKGVECEQLLRGSVMHIVVKHNDNYDANLGYFELMAELASIGMRLDSTAVREKNGFDSFYHYYSFSLPPS